MFEKSPDYIRSRSAIAAIHSLLPGIKLIALLRDPARRALSEFVHHCRHRRYIEIIDNIVIGAQYKKGSILNIYYSQVDLSRLPSSHYSYLTPSHCDASMAERYFTESRDGDDGGPVQEVSNGFYDEQLAVLFDRCVTQKHDCTRE